MDEAPPGDDMARILGASWDIILGSDLVYNEAGVDMLQRSSLRCLAWARSHVRTVRTYAQPL